MQHGYTRLIAFHQRLVALSAGDLPLRLGKQNELEPPSLTLDEDAWLVWQRFAQDIEDNCGPEGCWRPVLSSALKMAENAARIAGILTLFDNPKAKTINGETMVMAGRIAGFYLQEALRLVG